MYQMLSDRPIEEGLHIVFIYLNDITHGWFINSLLIAIWVIVCMGLYYTQLKASNQGDFPVCVAVAGFVTSIVAILLRLVTDSAGNHALMSLTSLGVVLIIAFVGILWLFFNKKE